MCSEDWGLGIRTPQGQLLLSMLYFVGTNECLDTIWDRDPVTFNLGGGCRRTHQQHPPGGSPSVSSSTFVVDAAGPAGSAPRGPAIEVFFNLSGGCCQTHWKHSLGGPPLISSSTSVLDAAGPTDSAPKGAPSMSSLTLVVDTIGPTGSAPRGPAINVVLNLCGGRYRTHQQCRPGGRHQRLLQPPSMSCNKW
jgi:hypothetical protein